MLRLRISAYWLLPLLLYSADALAWGLYTHFYLAQLLIWAIPLADPPFRRAVRRFPELLLAGACLPDTALFSRWVQEPSLRSTHQWSVAHRMLSDHRDDESRALAVGYASHLLADVIAHNYFVPEHERLWFDYPVVAHAVSEWAMDAHVAPHLFASPGELLTRHRARLARHAAGSLGCREEDAERALLCLTAGERFLRATRIPTLVRQAARNLDARMVCRFDHYIGETALGLRQLDRLIAGDRPVWNPEPTRTTRTHFLSLHVETGPLPQDLF